MGILSSIFDKILHHGQSSQSSPSQPSSQASAQQGAGTATGTAQQAQTGSAAAQQASGTTTGPSLQGIDIDATLSRLAASKGGGGNWRTSVVDLLKLLDLDSSLQARKTLANELNVHAGADGSAEQNIALQKAVMAKVAENGGKVPDSLRH